MHGFILLTEQALSDRIELVPGGAHFDVAATAMEQLDREGLLQCVDLFADGRLTDAEKLGSKGKAAGLGHRMKRTQPLVILVHASPVSVE
ncbi:hypothetical protein D3C78_1780190 [compost metagenome]